MSTTAIQSVLQQMQSLSAQAAGQPAKGQALSATVGAGSFAEELQASVARINQLQQHAAVQKRAFEAGVPGVSLNDVMVDSQKASIAFEMGVQVRNRLVSAYKEIMNMQV